MAADTPENALELRSLVTSQGTLELSLHDVPVPAPGDNEVLVRIEAAPINPSDLGLLIATADMSTATVAGTPERPVVTAALKDGSLSALSARVDQSLPVGNEGAGVRRGRGLVPGSAGPSRQDGGGCRRRDVLAVPSGECGRMSPSCPTGRRPGTGRPRSSTR